jgi:hypothetical protein
MYCNEPLGVYMRAQGLKGKVPPIEIRKAITGLHKY